MSETNTDESDAELVLASRAGDAAAFARLYRRHARAVLRYAWGRMGSGPAAEEMLQETFLTAWQKRDGARIVDESVLPWLLTICRNHALNEARRARKRVTLELPDVAAVEVPSDELAWMGVELAKLSPLDQTICRLCLVEGRSYEEAAEILTTTPAALGKRLQRARARLRISMGEDQ